MMSKNALNMNAYSSSLNWIHSQKQALLMRVQQWVAINSFSWNLEGLQQLFVLLKASFQTLGAEVSHFRLPPQKILQPDGTFHFQPLGSALLLRKRPQSPLQVLLGGHFDTVYAPNLSGHHVIEELTSDIWKGPGIADMKGGIAILLTALEAFERSSFAEQMGWEVLLTPDEEIGSPGSTFLYEYAARRHHCGLLFEPSFPDGAFVTERKGSASFTVIVHGKAAHVGRDYAKGRSAVFALARLIRQLEELKNQEDLTLNVADLEGKGPINIIPALASCRINFRSFHADTLLKATRVLQQQVLECQEEGILFEIVQDSLRLPKVLDAPTKQLFEDYARCARDLDLPFQTRTTGGVCDGNTLARVGLPTIDTVGAIGGALHTPDEYLLCSSLVERAQLAALFLLKLANQDIHIKQESTHG